MITDTLEGLTVRCLNCGADNADYARFCAHCGTELNKEVIKEQPSGKNMAGKKGLIGIYDKLFFFLPAVWASLFFILGLPMSRNVAFSDPLFSTVLRYLAYLSFFYLLAVLFMVTIRLWPDAGSSDVGGISNGLESPLNTKIGRIKSRLFKPELKRGFKFGGIAFTAIVLLSLVVVSFYPRPQFALRAVIVPDDVVYGEDISIVVEAENFGRAAGDCFMTLFIDDREVQHEYIHLGTAGSEAYRVNLEGDYQPGVYHLSLGMGSFKTIMNDFTASLRILTPAEIEIKSLELIPDKVNHDEESKARVEVKNSGEALGTVNLSLTVDGKLLETIELSVEGKREESAEFAINIADPGLHKVAINGVSEVLEVYFIERPGNGTLLLNNISGGRGQLKIINNYDVDTVFMFSKSGEPLVPLLAVYIHANSSTTVRGIKDGLYIGYYSTGRDWDTHSKKFTSSADYGRYEEEFSYITSYHGSDYTYWTWTAEFGITGSGEGAGTQYVDPARFPTLSE
jgi:hypothetical protein